MQGINAQLSQRISERKQRNVFFVMETFDGQDCRQGTAHPFYSAGSGGVCAAHHLRERSESADDPIDRKAQGICSAHRAGGEPRESALAIADGESAAVDYLARRSGSLVRCGESICWWRLIPESQLQAMPYLRDAGINLPVLLFLCGITVLTGILFGLAPGLEASHGSVNDVLKDESRGGTSAGHARLRNTLVIAEISISLVLLVGAGLLLKSLHALLGQDPGFNLHNVLTFSVNLPDSAYPSDKTPPYFSAAALRFDHEFTERLRGIARGAGRRTDFGYSREWRERNHPIRD